MGVRFPLQTVKIVVAGLSVLVAACQPPPPPPLPPPPPPPPPAPVVVQEVIPYRPIPPGGATYTMDIPEADAAGLRRTVNSDLDSDQAIWHFRSAWNVAALNCLGTANQPIVDGYRAFLKKYSKQLTKVNSAIDARFRKEFGAGTKGIKAREAHMTAVYNYFASPPVIGDLCAVALQIAAEAPQAQGTDLAGYAKANLGRIEDVYLKFFAAYDEYRIASAAWDVKYGDRYGYSQPGYVAVHGTDRPGIGATLAPVLAAPIAGAVTDPDTGATIPIVLPPAPTVGTPVVQPLPDDHKD